MFNPASIQTGMVARDRDGERLGIISAVDAGGFFIGKGPHFLSDYRVAFSDVLDIDNDDVYLREAIANLSGSHTGTEFTARSATRTENLPLQHDLTGGLGVAPQGGLEPEPLAGARFQGSAPRTGGLGVAPQGGLEQPPAASARTQDSGQMRGGLGLHPRDLEQARMDSAKFQDHGQMRGGLGLHPRDLEQARMDSAKFQDHGRYDVGGGADVVTRPAAAGRERRSEDVISDVDPAAVVAVRQPPVVVERRAALDEDEAPRRDAPTDFDPNTRR